jgi:hypothetical protein
MRPFPLPSSLAPLPRESLPGYLLRLAWRLELAPARIAELCGLAAYPDRGQVQVDQLIELPPAAAARLSAVASLTSAEVTDLTLSRYRHAYPALTARAGPGTITNAYTGTWAASFSSRYCPECLAGDALRPDGSFGGAWKLSWHLPVVFACTTHRRLLERACPACGSAVSSGRRGRVTLITRPDVTGLHPHQCRNPGITGGDGRRRRYEPLCGRRLDRPAGPAPASLSPADLDRLLSLQERIDHRLGGEPGGPADGYFPDLVATTRLLILSWPEGSGLAASPALASLIAEHAAPARTALTSSPDSTEGPRRARRGVSIWGPPGPAAQCGALILAADAVISGSDPASLRDQVQELAGAAARFHQRGLWHVRNMDLSPGYRRAIAPRGHGLRHVQVRASLLPPSRECLFTIEEIPPFLPRKWYDDRFAGLTVRIADPTSWTPRHLRRLASLKLAEMTAGGTWKQCSEQLGIHQGAAERSIEVLRRQLGRAGLWEDFDDIAEQIARALDEDEHRVNYAARRRMLDRWQIPEDHWAAICTDPHPAGPGPRTGPLDPAIGTVPAWESATQAEHLHSPLLTRMRRGGTGRRLNDKIAMFRTPSARKGSHLIILNRIEKYAALLARQCDTCAVPEIDLGELLPWDAPLAL